MFITNQEKLSKQSLVQHPTNRCGAAVEQDNTNHRHRQVDTSTTTPGIYKGSNIISTGSLDIRKNEYEDVAFRSFRK